MDELEQKVADMEKELSELRPLKDSTAKAQEEFKRKEEEWQKKVAELQGDINPNWQKARKSIESMRTALESKGVKVDDEGNVISNPQGVDIEKVRQEATQAARQELVGNRLSELLSQYDDASKGVVKHFFDKLTAGENVSVANIEKYVKAAHRAAEVETGNEIKRSVVSFSGGQGPRETNESNVSQENVNALGDLMGLSFRKEQKK